MNFPGLINVALAQTTEPSKLAILLSNINRVIINPLIILMFAVALAYFVYGAFVYIQNADNEEERSNGRKSMLWGIIGMFIMVGVFGIMKIIVATIGVKGINVETGEVKLPQ